MTCVCGGRIRDLLDRREAVREHQATRRHGAWVASGGLRAPSFDVEVRSVHADEFETPAPVLRRVVA